LGDTRDICGGVGGRCVHKGQGWGFKSGVRSGRGGGAGSGGRSYDPNKLQSGALLGTGGERIRVDNGRRWVPRAISGKGGKQEGVGEGNVTGSNRVRLGRHLGERSG